MRFATEGFHRRPDRMEMGFFAEIINERVFVKLGIEKRGCYEGVQISRFV